MYPVQGAFECDLTEAISAAVTASFLASPAADVFGDDGASESRRPSSPGGGPDTPTRPGGAAAGSPSFSPSPAAAAAAAGFAAAAHSTTEIPSRSGLAAVGLPSLRTAPSPNAAAATAAAAPNAGELPSRAGMAAAGFLPSPSGSVTTVVIAPDTPSSRNGAGVSPAVLSATLIKFAHFLLAVGIGPDQAWAQIVLLAEQSPRPFSLRSTRCYGSLVLFCSRHASSSFAANPVAKCC